MGVTGLEPNSITNNGITTCVDGRGLDGSCAAESGAVEVGFGFDDAGLAEVIERWAMLSAEQRRAVLAIVRE